MNPTYKLEKFGKLITFGNEKNYLKKKKKNLLKINKFQKGHQINSRKFNLIHFKENKFFLEKKKIGIEKSSILVLSKTEKKFSC